MGGFYVQDGIEVVFGEGEGLRVTGLEVDAEGGVGLAAEFDGFGVLVYRGVGGGLVIAFDEGGAASMPTTDFENGFPGQGCATGDVVVELDGGAVGFVGRVEGEGFAFGGPVAVVEEGDGVSVDVVLLDAAREGLVPVFPEGLLEGGHGVILRGGSGRDAPDGDGAVIASNCNVKAIRGKCK